MRRPYSTHSQGPGYKLGGPRVEAPFLLAEWPELPSSPKPCFSVAKFLSFAGSWFVCSLGPQLETPFPSGLVTGSSVRAESVCV